MNAEQAVEYLVDRLPEVAAAVAEHRQDYAEFSRRYWMAVERVALDGDDFVENALGVSLIEWFAWGDERHKAALRDAWPLLGSKTREIAKSWEADLNPPPARTRSKRGRRPSKRT